MNTRRAYTLVLCAITASFMPGCALFSKGDPGAARFFSINREPDRPGSVTAKLSGVREEPLELRLGRVTGAQYIEERLVFRDSANELGYYRERRWTEPPELFLKRLLAHALFEERGLRHVVGGSGPTIDVQLTALDEIRAPQRLARAQVVARLHVEHLVLWEEILTVDLPVIEKKDGDLAVATVEALGKAMQAVVDQIAESVVYELEERIRAQTISGTEGVASASPIGSDRQ
jgi:cholesterol transport system auxiliary component